MKNKLSNIIKKPEIIFIIFGSFFGLLSMIMMPALTIPDEGAHFWMSYGMFSKNRQIPNDMLVSAEDSAKFIKEGTYFEKIYLKKINFENDQFKINFTKNIAINEKNDSRCVSSLDITRLPQAIGITIGKMIYPSVGVMVFFGRLINFSVFIGVIYLIIKKVKYGKLGFLFLSLFPMMIHQAASLSYDVVNIVVIFAWIAMLINLSIQKTTITKKQIAKIVIIGVIITLTKPSNILLLALLLFLPNKTYKNTKIFLYIKNLMPQIKISKKSIYIITSILFTLFLLFGIYLFDIYLDRHGVSFETFAKALFNTFFRTDINTQLDPIVTTGIVGHFGWLWYKLPEWLVIIHLSIFGIVLLGEKTPKVSLRFAITSGLLFVLSILLITVGMYLFWTLLPNVTGVNATFIQGMQGRYFTPLLSLLIPLFAYIQQHISVKINQKLLCIIAILMSAFSLCVYLSLTYIYFY